MILKRSYASVVAGAQEPDIDAGLITTDLGLRNRLDKTLLLLAVLIPAVLLALMFLIYSLDKRLMWAFFLLAYAAWSFSAPYCRGLRNRAREFVIGDEVVIRYRDRTEHHTIESIYYVTTRARPDIFWAGESEREVEFSDAHAPLMIGPEIAQALIDAYRRNTGGLPLSGPIL